MRWVHGIAITLTLFGIGMLIAGVEGGLAIIPIAFAVALWLLAGLFVGRPLRNYRGDPTNPTHILFNIRRSEDADWGEMRLRRAARLRKRTAKRDEEP